MACGAIANIVKSSRDPVGLDKVLLLPLLLLLMFFVFLLLQFCYFLLGFYFYISLFYGAFYILGILEKLCFEFKISVCKKVMRRQGFGFFNSFNIPKRLTKRTIHSKCVCVCSGAYYFLIFICNVRNFKICIYFCKVLNYQYASFCLCDLKLSVLLLL